MNTIQRPLIALISLFAVALVAPLDAAAETAAQPCPAFEVSIANDQVIETDTSGFTLIEYQVLPWDEVGIDMAEVMQMTVSDPTTGTVFPGTVENPQYGVLFWRPDSALEVGSYDIELFVPAESLDLYGCGWGSVDQEWFGTLLVTDTALPGGEFAVTERGANGYEDYQYECCENGYGCWVSEAPFEVTMEVEIDWGSDVQPWQGVRLEGTSDGVPAEEAPALRWGLPDDSDRASFTFPGLASRYCVRVFELDARDGSEVEGEPICVLDEAVEYLPAVGTQPPLDCTEWRADDDDADIGEPDGSTGADADAGVGVDTSHTGADTHSGGVDTGAGGGVDAARSDWGPGGGIAGQPQDGANDGAECGCSSVRGTERDLPLGPLAAGLGLLGFVAMRRRRR